MLMFGVSETQSLRPRSAQLGQDAPGTALSQAAVRGHWCPAGWGKGQCCLQSQVTEQTWVCPCSGDSVLCSGCRGWLLFDLTHPWSSCPVPSCRDCPCADLRGPHKPIGSSAFPFVQKLLFASDEELHCDGTWGFKQFHHSSDLGQPVWVLGWAFCCALLGFGVFFCFLLQMSEHVHISVL